jgi:hypothetical protein
MMPGARAEDRRFWLVCAIAGVLLVLGCVLPTIEVGQGAFIGAGEEQRGFDYNRTFRFVTYFEPGALLFLLGGAGLIVLGLVGSVRGTRALLVVVAAVLSAVLVGEVVRIGDELQWDDTGVYGCDEPLEACVPFIAPAIRELQEDIQQRPEAADPEFELLARDGYRARGKLGWQVIVWTSIVIAAVTAFRAFQLALRPRWAGVAVALCGLVVLLVLFLRALEGLA